MSDINHAGEWLRLSEHYQRMTDGELIAIAKDRDKLTEIAQQILTMELSARKLKVEVEAEAENDQTENPDFANTAGGGAPPSAVHADSETSEYAGDPYAQDRELVQIETVWSLRDAIDLQRRLNVAGIPFFMGAEKATSVDAVTSTFPAGVRVQIMRIGVPWAQQALQYYEPKDVPESEKDPEWREDVDVRCPACRSNDIVFEEEVGSSNGPAKYKWKCGLCGHQWVDDGVATTE
jgi:hypothetical protein